MAKEIIIAIDPSSTSLGYAIFIDGILNLEDGYGCIKQKQKVLVEQYYIWNMVYIKKIKK